MILFYFIFCQEDICSISEGVRRTIGEGLEHGITALDHKRDGGSLNCSCSVVFQQKSLQK